MKIFNLGSGSTGNATLIFDDETLIMIDCGVGIRKITKALKEIGKGVEDVDAIFLTHGHGDHTSNAYHFPSEKIFSHNESLSEQIPENNVLFPGVLYEIKTFRVVPFKLQHDALCYGYKFTSTCDDETLVNITDTGFVAESDLPLIANAEYYIFESNHDTNMLLQSGRAPSLIKRIIGPKGHLNNYDASYYLSLLIGERTKAIFFAHLSRDCNTPELVVKAYKEVFLAQKGAVPSLEVYILHHDTMTKSKDHIKG